MEDWRIGGAAFFNYIRNLQEINKILNTLRCIQLSFFVY